MIAIGKIFRIKDNFREKMKIKNFFIIPIIFFLCLSNVFSMEPDIFVQSTVNRASAILGDNISKEKKN